jgi:hypothetical protein
MENNKDTLLEQYRNAMIKALTLVKHTYIVNTFPPHVDAAYEDAIKEGDLVMMEHTRMERAKLL